MLKLPRLKPIDRDDWLVAHCRGKRVLHIGCTDYPITRQKIADGRLLHLMLSKVASEIVGLDSDKQGISLLSESMPDKTFVIHNAENLKECSALDGQHFEAIVASDVLEHLSNIGLFLKGIRDLMSNEGVLYITIPHVFSIRRFLGVVFFGREHVHPDHTAYFSVSTILRILLRNGFVLEELHGFQWRNPTIKNRFTNSVILPFLWISGYRLCDELALVAKMIPKETVSERVGSDR